MGPKTRASTMSAITDAQRRDMRARIQANEIEIAAIERENLEAEQRMAVINKLWDDKDAIVRESETEKYNIEEELGELAEHFGNLAARISRLEVENAALEKMLKDSER